MLRIAMQERDDENSCSLTAVAAVRGGERLRAQRAHIERESALCNPPYSQQTDAPWVRQTPADKIFYTDKESSDRAR